MADITVTTDFSQVNELNAAIDRTSVIFAKTVATIVREQKSMERAIKASAAVQEEAVTRLSSKMSKDTQDWLSSQRRKLSMMAESEKMAQKQAASEAKLTAELVKQRVEAEKAGAVKSPVQQRVEASTGVGRQSATGQGAGFGAMEAEIERLRMKYDQIYASSNLYEKSLAELNRAHMLGVTSAKQHEAAVESLNLEYQSFQSGVAQAGNRFTQHVNQSASGMNNLGVAAQQTGYQVSDFIVQVQGGTNPLVAFSQQATQLAGLLYLLPPTLQAARIGMLGFSVSLATAFAGVTILIPLLSMLAMSFFSSGKDAKSGSDGINTFSGAIQRLTAEIEANQEAFLKAKFDTESSGVAGASQQIEDLRKQIPLVRAELDAFYMAVAQAGGISLGALFGDEGDALKENLDNLEKQLFTLEAQAEAQRMLNGHMSVSAAYVKGVTENLVRQRAEAERVKQAHADQVIYVGKTRKESDNFVASLKSAYILLGNSKVAAAGLADQMARAANAWITSNSAGGASYMASQYSSYGEGRAAAELLAKESGALYGGVSVLPDTTVGGGGGSSEPSESMLEKLQKQLELEKELLGTTETYQRVRSALGDEFINTSPMIVEGLMQQATEIENLTRLEEERKSLMDSVNGTLEGGFMAMVKGTQTVGEAFKSMAAAILEELFRVLVVQKLVAGFTGSPGGKTLGNLFVGPRASGGSMMSGQPYLVGEQGPELVIPRHSGTVVNANQTAGAMAGSGGITVQNNITVTGSDAAMVRQEVAKMIPQITSATKAAVIDAKQRGGQMAAAFR